MILPDGVDLTALGRTGCACSAASGARLYGLTSHRRSVEQIGSVFQSEAAVRVEIISSLLMPVESLWRRAAYLMQQSGMGIGELTPFAAFSPPSAAMVGYDVVDAVVALLLAMRSFNRRDL